MKRLMIAFGLVGLSIATAETYKVTLYQPSLVKGTELKPGNYKLDVKDNKVTILSGKKAAAEAAIKVESDAQRFNSTTVRYANSNGKLAIQEIRIGGTNTRLVFNE